MERHSCMKIRLNSPNAAAHNAAAFIRVLGRLSRKWFPDPTASRRTGPPRLPPNIYIFSQVNVYFFVATPAKNFSNPPTVTVSSGNKSRNFYVREKIGQLVLCVGNGCCEWVLVWHLY